MSKKTKTDECILQVKMNIPATSGGGRDLPRPKRWLRERCTSPVQGQAHNMRQNDAQAGITLGPLPIAGDRHLGVTHISPITPDTPLGEAAEAYLDHLLSLISCGLGSRENHHVREYGARFFGPLARLSLSSLRRSQIVLWADSLNNAKSESGNILVSARFTATVTLKAILSWCADRCDDLVNLPLLTRGIGGRYEPDVGRTLTLSEVQSLQDRLEIWAQLGSSSRATSRVVRSLVSLSTASSVKPLWLRASTTQTRSACTLFAGPSPRSPMNWAARSRRLRTPSATRRRSSSDTTSTPRSHQSHGASTEW